MNESIKFVLLETSHPGNIGASARAMKTMGFSELVLVNPKRFPAAEASERAAGADDLLYEATVVETIDAAISDAHFVLGTSARPRHLAVPEWSPERAAEVLAARLRDGPVALLFGRERSGLSNEELDRCQAFVRIRTNPDFSSLNLGAAVQLMAYELRRHLDRAREPAGDQAQSPSIERPTHAQLELMYAHFEETLSQIDYHNRDEPRLLMRRLRRLFNRSDLELAELQILRGMLSAVQRQLKLRSEFDGN
ncbi:MAG: RNA methyltransferase [Gammaproteobacteria bacterium]|nr:RNA methyltransferase [Gammaproteobacteria bacterium]